MQLEHSGAKQFEQWGGRNNLCHSLRSIAFERMTKIVPGGKGSVDWSKTDQNKLMNQTWTMDLFSYWKQMTINQPNHQLVRSLFIRQNILSIFVVMTFQWHLYSVLFEHTVNFIPTQTT